jgi:hypothetical protein
VIDDDRGIMGIRRTALLRTMTIIVRRRHFEASLTPLTGV